MKTYTISIGTLMVKVRSKRAHEKGRDEEISVKVEWSTLHKAWTTAKVYTMAAIRDLLVRYDEHLKQKERENMAKFPEHSILCEKRCCQKSLTSYMRFLKKELIWDKQGHLK